MTIGRDDNMHMIRAAVNSVKCPSANPAMVGDRCLDKLPLRVIEAAGILSHACIRLALKIRIRESHTLPKPHPSAIVAR